MSHSLGRVRPKVTKWDLFLQLGLFSKVIRTLLLKEYKRHVTRGGGGGGMEQCHKMAYGGGGLKSAKKVSRIIWMAPKRLTDFLKNKVADVLSLYLTLDDRFGPHDYFVSVVSSVSWDKIHVRISRVGIKRETLDILFKICRHLGSISSIITREFFGRTSFDAFLANSV